MILTGMREIVENNDAMRWQAEITGLARQIDRNHVFHFRTKKRMADALEVWINEEYGRNGGGSKTSVRAIMDRNDSVRIYCLSETTSSTWTIL